MRFKKYIKKNVINFPCALEKYIIYIFLYHSHPCVEWNEAMEGGGRDDDDGKLIAEKCDYDLEIKF